MVKANRSAMALIFPNIYDGLVPELTSERLMASIPFGGRYRMIDFILSSMVNSGIDNVSILVRENYFSLIDHLGSGREWDLARKNGGLTIFPPFAQNTISISNGRVEGIESILGFIKNQKEKYVVISDTNIAYNIDFAKIIDEHIKNGADVTVLYSKTDIPQAAKDAIDTSKGLYYTFDLNDDSTINKISINSKDDGVQNLSMNIYVIERELLIEKIQDAYVNGGKYFERDILIPHLDELKIVAREYDGYIARVYDMVSYFNENMKLLDDENLDALFGKNPVYTKIRDDNPTRYIAGAKSANTLVADGCIIEGEVENSILFRGVKVGKGAIVKNCILMQDTVIEAGAKVDHVITDKKVTISAEKEVKGTDTFPVYISKRTTI
ncbi:MAG: glucose-1-phosphate adenylyltransferase subunit GlgD [Eubacteriales bacterium]|nr:glucose-1-phosphate adenylyltransferase subunit GlgD [Eubacteriales bacterium]